MGSTGNSGTNGLSKNDYQQMGEFHSNEEALKWFQDNSNINKWLVQDLTSSENSAIEAYTGSGYTHINRAQYNTPWEDMNDYDRGLISNLHNAISKFELNKPIVVYRESDFQILGSQFKGRKTYGNNPVTLDDVKDSLRALNNGVVQNDGFMSFTTHAQGHGIAGSGLLIRLHIPESKGAGGYVAPISQHGGESEFLVNNNAVLKLDINSVRPRNKEYPQNGYIVDAYWLGQAQAQTISPTYTGKVKKKRGK